MALATISLQKQFIEYGTQVIKSSLKHTEINLLKRKTINSSLNNIGDIVAI